VIDVLKFQFGYYEAGLIVKPALFETANTKAEGTSSSSLTLCSGGDASSLNLGRPRETSDDLGW
jgi:hypothetical protein